MCALSFLYGIRDRAAVGRESGVIDAEETRIDGLWLSDERHSGICTGTSVSALQELSNLMQDSHKEKNQWS